MLDDHGISDVRVISTPGRLTDHYNPLDKTVNLSEAVYSGRNASAAAVAAHEVGHAVQHAEAYQWLTMRSQLVPIVQVSSGLSTWIVIIGIAPFFRRRKLLWVSYCSSRPWAYGNCNCFLALLPFLLNTMPAEEL